MRKIWIQNSSNHQRFELPEMLPKVIYKTDTIHCISIQFIRSVTNEEYGFRPVMHQTSYTSYTAIFFNHTIPALHLYVKKKGMNGYKYGKYRETCFTTFCITQPKFC